MKIDEVNFVMIGMINVLYVESGRYGGGSFESLYRHLQVIDRSKFNPIVVFLNETRFVGLVRGLGVRVYILTDLVHSMRVPRIIGGSLRHLAIYIDKYVPLAQLIFSRLAHSYLVNKLKQIVTNEKVDLIHLNNSIDRDIFGLFVAEKTGVACVSHLRSLGSWNSSFSKGRSAYTNRYVSAYIANSNMTQNYWLERGIDRNKTWRVHNGIPIISIEPLDIRNRWGIEDRIDFVIGCASNFILNKGQDFLIRAFEKFLRVYPDSILVFVGDGALKEVSKNMVRVLGLEEKVLFVGYETRAKELIAGFDVLVVPSVYDSFGRTVLEAMLAGTPVIATDVGSIREIIQQGINGQLINYGDEDGFVVAMEKLIDDQQFRTILIDNGKNTIRERYSIVRYASEIEAIYTDVLAE